MHVKAWVETFRYVKIVMSFHMTIQYIGQASPLLWSPNRLGPIASGQSLPHSLFFNFPNTHTQRQLLLMRIHVYYTHNICPECSWPLNPVHVVVKSAESETSVSISPSRPRTGTTDAHSYFTPTIAVWW